MSFWNSSAATSKGVPAARIDSMIAFCDASTVLHAA